MNAFLIELGCIWRLVRRWFYLTFRRKYVLRQVAGRKGVCGRHGCCDLSMLAKYRKCIDPDDRTKCLKWDDQPFACRMYPFDEKDKHPATLEYCDFHWDDDEEPEAPAEASE